MYTTEASDSAPSQVVDEIDNILLDPEMDYVNDKYQHGFNIAAGKWYAAVYDGMWYLGTVDNIDMGDNEAYMTFLKTKNVNNPKSIMFQWPTNPDEVWIDFKNIICECSEPMLTGRSARILCLEISE